ncbi:hypothetical protein BTVI_157329 [Pitangus sulphuratus]|nr:hypothetical protein BTVI_157329 [Pitangus sulphuratus]
MEARVPESISNNTECLKQLSDTSGQFREQSSLPCKIQLLATWLSDARKFNDRVESVGGSCAQAEVCDAMGIVPGHLRHPHRADEQICVYPEYQPYSKRILDISDPQYGLDKQTVRWIENLLNDQAQEMVISSTKPSWRPVARGNICSFQGTILGTVLFKIFINDLDDGAE